MILHHKHFFYIKTNRKGYVDHSIEIMLPEGVLELEPGVVAMAAVLVTVDDSELLQQQKRIM